MFSSDDKLKDLASQMHGLTCEIRELTALVKVVIQNTHKNIDKDDSDLIKLEDVLNKHLMLAEMRYGLENSSPSAHTSFMLGLSSIERISLQGSKEFEAVGRYTKGLIKELKTLESRAQISEIVDALQKDMSRYKSKPNTPAMKS